MGIYQTCRLFYIESAGLITYCDTDTSQLRKIAFQKFPIYGSSVHIHQLFFASFKNADSGNERQYFVTVIHGVTLQKLHQSVPVFGYGRNFIKIVPRCIRGMHILLEAACAVGSQYFIVLVCPVRRGVSADGDARNTCQIPFGERAHQAVQFLQFGAVVVEFAADVINSGRVVYI